MVNPKPREQGAWSWFKSKFLMSFRDPEGMGLSAMKSGENAVAQKGLYVRCLHMGGSSYRE